MPAASCTAEADVGSMYPVLADLDRCLRVGGYETVRESLDTNAYPMPGQLVDVAAQPAPELHWLRKPDSGVEPGLGEASG